MKKIHPESEYFAISGTILTLISLGIAWYVYGFIMVIILVLLSWGMMSTLLASLFQKIDAAFDELEEKEQIENTNFEQKLKDSHEKRKGSKEPEGPTS